ncbi:HAMP domain-containing sensor histidine kinase [Neobacillus cucumis]|uniref:HAMP domain-containing sensor histidine kinase n=1 Tax=Neobacillus cucumis TaxID=1740721 RepID=UPI00196426EA|nr:HAMP domain-containing sensor histidine kinase [Neobacillus cucumis]MBM7653420.1 signal transduction histidine kinase [Neobacillus cucumis]
MNNNKTILPFLRSGGYLDKLVQLVKTSIRIQVIIGFVLCIAISTLVGLAASPFFFNEDRRLDFTEGVVTIDESARDLIRQFNEMNQDLNGLVIELGDQDPAFKRQYLNRVQTNTKGSQPLLTVPYEGNSVYRITKNELIQYVINKPKQQTNLFALLTNSDGKVLYKSQGVSETVVDIQTEISKSQQTLVGKEHNKSPTVTRIYQITLEGEKHYIIVSGVPKSTTVYMKETGVTPYVLGVLTFILCFYLITKRKMREIEEIALGLMEIAKGNLKYRIREKSQDELGSLATNINYMASELDEMIERQRENEKLKDELITNVSHDLRTPLTSIMGYLRLVKDHQYKKQNQLDEYVDIAYGKSEQLKKLIEDLFDFTRLTYEGTPLKKEKVSLNQMLRQLIGELDPIAKDHQVMFDTHLPKEPILMEVDPNQMVRALENILTNAIKYSTPPGNIVVKMAKSDQSVQISVANPCEALSKDEVTRLFDRFYRVDTSRSSNKSGAGLGLAITKSIVELHHGTIHVDYQSQIIELLITLPLQQEK